MNDLINATIYANGSQFSSALRFYEIGDFCKTCGEKYFNCLCKSCKDRKCNYNYCLCEYKMNRLKDTPQIVRKGIYTFIKNSKIENLEIQMIRELKARTSAAGRSLKQIINSLNSQ